MIRIFFIFVFSKQLQLFWNLLHKVVININIYAQKVKCFVFVEKVIQAIKPILTGGALKLP